MTRVLMPLLASGALTSRCVDPRYIAQPGSGVSREDAVGCLRKSTSSLSSWKVESGAGTNGSNSVLRGFLDFTFPYGLASLAWPFPRVERRPIVIVPIFPIFPKLLIFDVLPRKCCLQQNADCVYTYYLKIETLTFIRNSAIVFTVVCYPWISAIKHDRPKSL